MRVEFHPEAQEEFLAAVEYYEAAAQGLGRRFLLAVRETVDLIMDHPDVGQPRSPSTRRVVVAEFPYDVLYRIVDDALIIIAIAHQRRRPGYWRRRG